MNKTHLAIRVKELRVQRGMSQEFLAEESGLSLRTVQRIENSQSNPTGESLKRLAHALEVTPDDLMDWAPQEDQSFLIYLNLSALTFLVFPLLGIVVPFMLWTSKKGKVKNIDGLGRGLVNFQLTWTIALFFIPVLLFVLSKIGVVEGMSLRLLLFSVALWYAFNVCFILLNTLRLGNHQKVFYWPQIRFLR